MRGWGRVLPTSPGWVEQRLDAGDGGGDAFTGGRRALPDLGELLVQDAVDLHALDEGRLDVHRLQRLDDHLHVFAGRLRWGHEFGLVGDRLAGGWRLAAHRL